MEDERVTPTFPFAVRVEPSANRVIDAMSDESTMGLKYTS